jgi:hypothetical protein
MKSTSSSNVIWRNLSRTRQLTIICNCWTIAKTFDDFWQDEIKNILHISRIFHRRISNFSSTQASDFTTIALNFSINRNTITEINKEIKRINFSINSTIEDFIKFRIKMIMFSIETFKDNSIEIFKCLIISNRFFLNKVRELNNSIMIFEIFRKS